MSVKSRREGEPEAESQAFSSVCCTKLCRSTRKPRASCMSPHLQAGAAQSTLDELDRGSPGRSASGISARMAGVDHKGESPRVARHAGKLESRTAVRRTVDGGTSKRSKLSRALLLRLFGEHPSSARLVPRNLRAVVRQLEPETTCSSRSAVQVKLDKSAPKRKTREAQTMAPCR